MVIPLYDHVAHLAPDRRHPLGARGTVRGVADLQLVEALVGRATPLDRDVVRLVRELAADEVLGLVELVRGALGVGARAVGLALERAALGVGGMSNRRLPSRRAGRGICMAIKTGPDSWSAVTACR